MECASSGPFEEKLRTFHNAQSIKSQTAEEKWALLISDFTSISCLTHLIFLFQIGEQI